LHIREAVIAPRSPWQDGYAERVIGSIRRECLDHVVVIGERHLLQVLAGSWRFLEWVASITSACGEPREPIGRISGRHHDQSEVLRAFVAVVDRTSARLRR
jgi:hypothetical protein